MIFDSVLVFQYRGWYTNIIRVWWILFFTTRKRNIDCHNFSLSMNLLDWFDEALILISSISNNQWTVFSLCNSPIKWWSFYTRLLITPSVEGDDVYNFIFSIVFGCNDAYLIWFNFRVGFAYRKKKAVHKTNTTDDKRLQSTLKRIGVNGIPAIEEVNIFKDETVIQFLNPKGQNFKDKLVY